MTLLEQFPDLPVVLAKIPDWFISWKSWLFRILHASIQGKSCNICRKASFFWCFEHKKLEFPAFSTIRHHPTLRVLYILKDVWKYISASTASFTAQLNIYVKPRMAWNHSGPAAGFLYSPLTTNMHPWFSYRNMEQTRDFWGPSSSAIRDV